MSALFCLGVSHHTAAVEWRERFAVTEAALPGVLAALRAAPGVAEAVLLSTCNRVEWYVAGEETALGALQHFVQEKGAAMPMEPIQPTAFYCRQGAAVAEHLFRVASGLDSMLLGETEILGQVKRAYQAAVAVGSTGRVLNKLFQRALQTAKEARATTGVTRGAVSIGSAAVALAEKIFGALEHCEVMILGAGETSELTARALVSRGARTLFVANRTHERAAALAATFGGEAVRYETFEERLETADIVIASTADPRAVITREKLAPVLQRRPERPLFLIDLAVPRDVEPEVRTLTGAHLYDIDSLQALAQEGLALRQQARAECEAIITRHAAAFEKWRMEPPSLPLRL